MAKAMWIRAVVGVAVGLGVYYLAVWLGAGPRVAGGVGGGVGAYLGMRVTRTMRGGNADD